MISLRYRDVLPPGPILDEFESLVTQLRAFLAESFDEDGSLITETPEGTVEIGMVFDFAGSVLPSRYAWCDGSQVSRVTYKTLFERIGTTYGAGDGSTTFNLPDARQKFTLGKAAAGTGSVLGATGGAIDHTHTGGSHQHTWSGSGNTGSNGGFSASTSSNGGQTTSSDGSHGHGMSALQSAATSTAGSVECQAGTGFFAAVGGHAHFTVSGGGSGSTDSAGSHSHTVSDHSHSVSVGDHTHTVALSGSTSSDSSGTTGANNPPYIVFNKIIYTGVA